MKTARKVILDEIASALLAIDDDVARQFVRELAHARRIYLAGVGRSGLVVKAFGQRLMHLGFEVHLADEITATGISRGDLLVACSGSGTTQLTTYMAKKAASICARGIALTAMPRSPLARHSRLLIRIPAPLDHNGKSRQPARTLFEQTLFLYLDSIVLDLMHALGVRPRKIERRHANLE